MKTFPLTVFFYVLYSIQIWDVFIDCHIVYLINADYEMKMKTFDQQIKEKKTHPLGKWSSFCIFLYFIKKLISSKIPIHFYCFKYINESLLVMLSYYIFYLHSFVSGYHHCDNILLFIRITAVSF